MNEHGCIPAKIYLQMYDLTKEANFWPYSLISTLLMVNNTVVYTTLEVMYILFLLLIILICLHFVIYDGMFK